MDIKELTHPNYDAYLDDWTKWRLTYGCGRNFVQTYLKKLSHREDTVDFEARRDMTYCPGFAKAAIEEIKNSIFERLSDIARLGGSSTYQNSMQGNSQGVDLRGNAMNTFLGCKVLPELLSMAKVGVFIDMPPITGRTLKDAVGKTPYLYTYRAEDIRSWALDLPESPNEFSRLLLRDNIDIVDEDLEVPTDTIERYRYLQKVENGVILRFYNKDSQQTDYMGNPSNEDILLTIPSIPFVLFELPVSLMADAADYQIALLNLESADINYIRRSNFPFYTEQFDPRTEGLFTKQPKSTSGDDDDDGTGKSDVASSEIKVGPTQGRRYPINTERPAFINPSAEPLRVSMEKEQQIKDDIRQLVNLALTTLNPRMASAESKQMDNQGLESGLSFIGLILEKGENKIAEYWSLYEGQQNFATVSYPKTYSLKSDSDRQTEAEGKQKLVDFVPSDTYKRELAKQIAKIMLRGEIDDATLTKINSEIDKAPTMTSDAKIIDTDIKNGLVSLETASLARGYKTGEVEKAKQDHAERVARTLAAQTSPGGQARGVPDMQNDQKTSSTEKENMPGRGEAL